MEFSGAGTLEPDLGETLFLYCSATSFHVIELLEIGQNYSIDEKLSFDHPAQPGNPVTRYEPEGCSFMEEERQCSKVVTITVTEKMDGKAYQCLAFRRDHEHIITYSKGGYVRGMYACIFVWRLLLMFLPLCSERCFHQPIYTYQSSCNCNW